MRTITIFSVILLLIGCVDQTREKSTGVKTIFLEAAFNETGSKIPLSRICNEIRYCFLETNDSIQIGRIKKIQIHDTLILVVEDTRLFIFGLSGRYLNRIDLVGQGPGEYVDIDEVVYEPRKEAIYIYNNDAHRINSYKANGQYLETWQFTDVPSTFNILNGEHIVLQYDWPTCYFSENQNFSLRIYDPGTRKTVSSMLNKAWDMEDKEKMRNMYQSYLYNYYDTLSHWEFYYDTIYRITSPNTVIPRYHFDLGRYRMPNEDRKTKFIPFMQNVGYSAISSFVESKDYIFLTPFSINRIALTIIYDKKEDKAKNVNYAKNTNEGMALYNDIDGGWSFWPQGITNTGVLYQHFFAHDLKEFMVNSTLSCQNPLYPDKRKSLLEKAQKSSMLDNPVIMLVIPK
jgi:hypothetical protein